MAFTMRCRPADTAAVRVEKWNNVRVDLGHDRVVYVVQMMDDFEWDICSQTTVAPGLAGTETRTDKSV